MRGYFQNPTKDDTAGHHALMRALAMAEAIVPRLRRGFPGLDDAQVHDAVTDAILDWLFPAAYGNHALESSKLYRAAWRNARDQAKSEDARWRREHSWAMVQRVDQWLSTDRDDELVAREICRTIGDALPDPRMQVIFRLYARGERSTSVFAAALGVERLPLMEQRRLIKREKDRLLKLLHRNYAVREIVRKRWPANR